MNPPVTASSNSSLPFFIRSSPGLSIVIKGVGIELLIPETLTLGGFAVVLLGLAAVRFRKTLD